MEEWWKQAEQWKSEAEDWRHETEKTRQQFEGRFVGNYWQNERMKRSNSTITRQPFENHSTVRRKQTK